MNRKTFFDRLHQNPRPIVVEVWAPWCLPCRTISPALERLSQQYLGRVDLWKINADQEPELMQALGILAVPTLMVFREGREVMRLIGAQSQVELIVLFKTAMEGTPPEVVGLPGMERTLRLFVGLSLLILGGLSSSLLLLFAGGIVLFSGIYDRCPLWRIIAPRLKQAFTHPNQTRNPE